MSTITDLLNQYISLSNHIIDELLNKISELKEAKEEGVEEAKEEGVEDGKVRVYLKIKPLEGINKAPINIIENALELTCNKLEINGGSFHKIIRDNEANDSIVNDIITELKSNRSLCLFGYGISGSEETDTILGEGGILKEIIKNFSNVKIRHVFEQYLKDIIVHNESTKYNQLKSITGKIIDYKIKKNLVEEEKNDININKISTNDQKIGEDSIIKFLNNIKEYRKRKEIPNNITSSRSTLYIVFEVKENVNLIIVDCAYREIPEKIKDELIKGDIRMSEILDYIPSSNLSNLVEKHIKNNKILTDIDHRVTDFKTYQELTEKQKQNQEAKFKFKFKEDLLNYLQSMFKEGYYINESLNHLIFFLNKKINSRHKAPKIQTCVEKCEKGENDYDRLKVFRDPSEPKDPVKTMTIMNWIEKKYNPKYMMFCMIRQENDKCIDIAETLKFANSIKST